ncbi:GAF and ANTAR domain-containing protein [Geodermatophilus sp. FMUSA9-8]|uniref:GAF and ANTAR domain-containing protein n=1 Tax=Geodermatophilus sp. FMUSA9-8 TaxID=3120155 RepID=UPI00300A69BC
MSEGQPATELALEFFALNDYLRAGGDRTSALQRLVELATSSVPGCEWAGVTVWPADSEPRTLARSGDVAQSVDDLQYELGEGPCLTATSDRAAVHISDVATENRWPAFCSASQERTPLRGVLSFHLADEPHRSALNLYTARPGAFDDDAFGTGALFAAHARVLMLHADAAVKATDLTQALSTSRQIGAAVGILMNAHKITADRAFQLLACTSQQLNRKLRDIAEDVTLTGILPNKR